MTKEAPGPHHVPYPAWQTIANEVGVDGITSIDRQAAKEARLWQDLAAEQVSMPPTDVIPTKASKQSG